MKGFVVTNFRCYLMGIYGRPHPVFYKRHITSKERSLENFMDDSWSPTFLESAAIYSDEGCMRFDVKLREMGNSNADIRRRTAPVPALVLLASPRASSPAHSENLRQYGTSTSSARPGSSIPQRIGWVEFVNLNIHYTPTQRPFCLPDAQRLPSLVH